MLVVSPLLALKQLAVAVALAQSVVLVTHQQKLAVLGVRVQRYLPL
jgi:hypothetical protein